MRLLILAVVPVAGCVSFPLPPTDMANMQAGQLGRLRLQLVAKWEPNWSGVLTAAMNRPRMALKSLAK